MIFWIYFTLIIEMQFEVIIKNMNMNNYKYTDFISFH